MSAFVRFTEDMRMRLREIGPFVSTTRRLRKLADIGHRFHDAEFLRLIVEIGAIMPPQFPSHDLEIELRIEGNDGSFGLDRFAKDRERHPSRDPFGFKQIGGQAVDGRRFAADFPAVRLNETTPLEFGFKSTIEEDHRHAAQTRLSFGVGRTTPIEKAGRFGVENAIFHRFINAVVERSLVRTFSA